MRHPNFKPIALIVALTLVLAIGTGMVVFWTLKPAAAKTKPGAGELVMDTIPGRTNILVMGVDPRENDVGRSDAMVLVSIDSKGKPFLLSIPRDTRAKIKGYGFDKINAAYAYGGPELSVRTVSDFLGIPINDYLVVDIDAFVHIVDVFGGVTIDVEKRMYHEDPYQDLLIDLQPGVQRLNGERAMQYVRFRDDLTADLGRIERQQKFLTAVAKEAFSLRNVTKLPTFIRECYNAIDTDMSMTQLIKLATTAAKAYEKGIEMEMLPGEPEYIGEISYFLPDVNAIRQLVADRVLTDLDVTTYLAQGERQADEYESSLLAERGKATVVADGALQERPENVTPAKPDSSKPDDSKSDTPDAVPSDPVTNPDHKPSEPPQPPTSSTPMVEIFDASGGGRAPAVKQQLGAMGFRVTQTVTSEQTQAVSTVIVYTEEPGVLATLRAALPQAQIIPGGTNTSGVMATIIIGKDL